MILLVNAIVNVHGLLCKLDRIFFLILYFTDNWTLFKSTLNYTFTLTKSIAVQAHGFMNQLTNFHLRGSFNRKNKNWAENNIYVSNKSGKIF